MSQISSFRSSQSFQSFQPRLPTEEKNENKVSIHGYLVDKQFAQFLQFHRLVKFAEQCLVKGFSIHGSFIHYVVWCGAMKTSPDNVDSMKEYIGTGRHIPEDLDVQKSSAKTQDFCTLFDVERTKGPDNSFNLSVVYSVKNTDFPLSTPLKVDVCRDKKSCPTDFDVNSLTLTNQGVIVLGVLGRSVGIPCSCKENGHKFECMTKRNRFEEETKQNILARKAKFLDVRSRSTLSIKRLKKMLDRGFTIEGWNDWYRKLHLETVCIICQENCSEGYQTVCGGKYIQQLICEPCFWRYMEEMVVKTGNFVCPLCRRADHLFGFTTGKSRLDEPVDHSVDHSEHVEFLV